MPQDIANFRSTRVLQRQVANRLAEQILGGHANAGDTVRVVPASGGLALETEPAGASEPDAEPAAVAGEA